MDRIGDETLRHLAALTAIVLLVLAAITLVVSLRRRSTRQSLQETRESLATTQDQLSLEQHLLAALVDNMPDAIYFKDRQSGFIRCNQTTADMFQVASPADVIGRTDHDFFNRREANEYRGDELHIMHSGEPIINKEEYELWRDGKHHWVLSTKLPLRDSF